MSRQTRRHDLAFWILAGLFLMMFFAAAAASPLYRVYQGQFHFSAATLTAVFAVGIPGVLAMAEPGSRRPGVLASLRPRIAVPRQARGTFGAAVPSIVAVWALGGLYLSLGPSLAAQATGSPNLLWGGLVIFLLCGTSPAPWSQASASARPSWVPSA